MNRELFLWVCGLLAGAGIGIAAMGLLFDAHKEELCPDPVVIEMQPYEHRSNVGGVSINRAIPVQL